MMEGGDHLCGDKLEQDRITCVFPSEHVSEDHEDAHISHKHVVPDGLSGLIGNIEGNKVGTAGGRVSL